MRLHHGKATSYPYSKARNVRHRSLKENVTATLSKRRILPKEKGEGNHVLVIRFTCEGKKEKNSFFP